jgi:hypothetical protein
MAMALGPDGLRRVWLRTKRMRVGAGRAFELGPGRKVLLFFSNLFLMRQQFQKI